MTISEVKIDDFPLFSKAPKAAIEFLKSKGKLSYFRPRQILYKAGTQASHVYLVLHGGLKIQKNHSQNVTIFDFITRGGLGGYLYNLEETKVYMFTGIAVEHTSVLSIPTKDFEEFLHLYPSCNSYVQCLIGKFMNEVQLDRSLAKERVPLRLANFLIKMLERKSNPLCSSIMLKLSRQDIANRIGTEPETIIRILTKWTQLEVIETKNKIISIKNKKFLECLITEQDINEKQHSLNS